MRVRKPPGRDEIVFLIGVCGNAVGNDARDPGAQCAPLQGVGENGNEVGSLCHASKPPCLGDRRFLYYSYVTMAANNLTDLRGCGTLGM